LKIILTTKQKLIGVFTCTLANKTVPIKASYWQADKNIDRLSMRDSKTDLYHLQTYILTGQILPIYRDSAIWTTSS